MTAAEPDPPYAPGRAALAGQTLVARIMQSGPAVALMSPVPVPLRLARAALARDNAKENAKDSWGRLRDSREQVRYGVVREAVERHAAHGFVLDIGCSQGILQEGLRYGRYLGVDSFPASVTRASAKSDDRTGFVCADGSGFVADRAPDAVVLNEVLYYLPDPVGTAEHYAAQLAPDGVLVVSVYARSWACRRLLRRLDTALDQIDRRLAVSGHLAWSVVTYRPR